jgi:hypothetical protein
MPNGRQTLGAFHAFEVRLQCFIYVGEFRCDFLILSLLPPLTICVDTRQYGKTAEGNQLEIAVDDTFGI